MEDHASLLHTYAQKQREEVCKITKRSFKRLLLSVVTFTCRHELQRFFQLVMQDEAWIFKLCDCRDYTFI